MKNATRYCAGPAYYRMCSTDVYCSKQTGSSSTKGKPSPAIISSFLELGRRKLSMQPKFQAAQKMLLNRNPANIRKWIARFYYFRHLYFRWKRVCIAHNNCGWAAHRYGQLYLHCSLIYFWVPSSCFCIVISLSEGEIIPFSGVCQSGGGCIIHAGGGGGFTHWLTDCFDATDDDQRQHHHAEHHFQL